MDIQLSSEAKLPSEIIMLIFYHLSVSPPDQVHPFSFILNDAHPWSSLPLDITQALLLRQRGYAVLLDAILVCKMWCSIGTEALYAHLVFLSPNHIHRLRLTLVNHPLLKPLVRGLYIPCLPNNTTLDSPDGRSRAERTDEQRRLFGEWREELTAIFEICSPNTILLNVQSISPSFPLPSIPPDSPSFSTLRSLTVDTWPLFNFIITQVALPHLEFLCLRAILSHQPIIFPHLPRLRTLRVAGVNFWSTFQMTRRDVPSLCELECYGIGFQLPFITAPPGVALEHWDFPRFSHVYYRGSVPITFPSFAGSLPLSMLSHVSIGLSDHVPFASITFLSDWCLPRSVKVLEIFIVVSAGSAERNFENGSLRLLAKCFQQNGGNLRLLEKVVIRMRKIVKDDTFVRDWRGVEELVQEISSVVRQAGVDIEFRPE